MTCVLGATARIVILGIVLIALCLVCSCAKEKVSVSIEPTTDLTFSIKFNQDQLTPSSRSDSNEPWSGPYDSKEATGWEMAMKSMAVYVYTKEGAYLGRFTDMIQVGSDTYHAHLINSGGAYVQGNEVDNKTLRFHVFVNVVPDATASEDGLFGFNNISWYNAAGKYARASMPMWGMKEIEMHWDASLQNMMDIGTVDLLRSVAKVEVVLNNTDDYDYIDYIALSGNLAKDICLVPGYSDTEGEYAVKNVVETKALMRYYDDFKTESQDTFNNSVVFYSMSGDKTRAIFYIPEQVNTALGGEVTMTITAGGETFSDSPLRFRHYEEGVPVGEPFNIIRNHHYLYNITVKKGSLSISVVDWEKSFDNQFYF